MLDVFMHPILPKSGRGCLQEVVVYHRFQQQGRFDLADSFGVLNMLSPSYDGKLTEGGRLREDCLQ